MVTKKDFENSVRSARDFNDLKQALIELVDLLPEEFDEVERRELELVSERVSNIENCLDKNSKKLNIEDLRL